MRLLSWNILAGGGSRCGSILEVLRRHDADIIALQETMPGRAADLCHVLGRLGYQYRFSTSRPDQRGQCVLSRVPLVRVAARRPPHARIYPRGWLELELVGFGVRLAAVYGPPQGPLVPAFWNAAATWLRGRTSVPFLMLGDFNAGASLIDAADYRFKCGDAFGRLTEIGLIDLWRREHGQTREHTWFSPSNGTRGGRGFRIDHAFASPAFAQRVTGCRYDHAVRERRWSDHSLLVLDVSLQGHASSSLRKPAGFRPAPSRGAAVFGCGSSAVPHETPKRP
jgi:exodeoxyribonuclease III